MFMCFCGSLCTCLANTAVVNDLDGFCEHTNCKESQDLLRQKHAQTLAGRANVGLAKVSNDSKMCATPILSCSSKATSQQT
eukprot:6320320-Amphidinium_carterae.1